MSETPMTCAACGQVVLRESLSTCPHCGRDLHPLAEEAGRLNRPHRFDDKPSRSGIVATIADRLKKVLGG